MTSLHNWYIFTIMKTANQRPVQPNAMWLSHDIFKHSREFKIQIYYKESKNKTWYQIFSELSIEIKIMVFKR